MAQKDAYEVREAARALDLEVLLLGAELEGASFWNDVRTCRHGPAGAPFGWLGDVMAVVQPALVEDPPRRLLAAMAADPSVVASSACGLTSSNVVTVAPPDAESLTNRLRAMLEG